MSLTIMDGLDTTFKSLLPPPPVFWYIQKFRTLIAVPPQWTHCSLFPDGSVGVDTIPASYLFQLILLLIPGQQSLVVRENGITSSVYSRMIICKTFYVCIGVQPINNCVIASGEQQRDSAM